MLIFIDKGILSVHLNSNDNDVDCAFAFEGMFYCELSGFFRNLPSPYGIRAIEDTVLYYIKRNDMNSLYDLNPKYERLARLIWEEGMIEMSKTLVLHQTEKAKNRYIKEIENNRDLMKIPQKNISSYLGITPSSLSRIRNSPINGYKGPESNNE